MNEKGFSMVELLAAIALLSILTVFLVVSLNGYSKDLQEKAYQAKIDNVLIGAKNWGEDNLSNITKSCTNKTIGWLINSDYVDGDSENKTVLKNPITNESMNEINICIYLSETKHSDGTYTHKVSARIIN